MPTINGTWQAGNRARVNCVYSINYNADHTSATVTARGEFESRYEIFDSSNSWGLSGSLGSDSGSNLSINHGSSGGTTLFGNVSATRTSNSSVKVSIAGLNAYGITIDQTFTIPIGDLAPYVTGFSATNISASAFTASITSANANGGSWLDARVMYNTSPSTSGASTRSNGSWGHPRVTGLTRDTLYYYRMQVRNSTYGWGPWTSWKSFRTLETVPGSPGSGWSFIDITQISMGLTGLSVSDNGGSAITGWQVQWNKSASTSGASTNSTSSGSSFPSLSNLVPGTRYYARVRAKNAKGWGAWSGWKSAETLPGVYVRYNGAWVNAVPYVKHNGVWKPAVRYVKHNGSWT